MDKKQRQISPFLYSSYTSSKGFSLLELLITLIISSIVLSVGVPSFIRIIERSEFRSELSLIHRTISMGHAKAALNGWTVALCPLNAANKCTNDWEQTLTLFEDRNRNQKKETNEPILYLLEANDDDRVMRKFSRNAPITFNPQGNAFGFNGTLTYCQNGRSTLGGTIIIANSGRVRLGEDKNNDGIVENSSGHNIDCNG